jgi:two-component SAPR family response regulator
VKAEIVEDKVLIAKELCNKTAQIADDLDVIDILPGLRTAKKWFLKNAEPDLIFVDVQLPNGISFELFDIYQVIVLLFLSLLMMSMHCVLLNKSPFEACDRPQSGKSAGV